MKISENKEHKVSVVKYKQPIDSVREVVKSSQLFDTLKKTDKIFIKPNIVYWNQYTNFPKWGVITTSRVIEDVVILLNERGINNISIGETFKLGKNDENDQALDAFEKLGYNSLKKKYNVNLINILTRPYKLIDIGCDFKVEYSSDALEADVVIDIPVMKTHAQAVTSLAFKNLLGLTHNESRKKIHSADPLKDLNYNLAHLPNKLKKVLTIIDGIYTLERGPAIDGKAHRKNILVASTDMLSADLVGTKLLGIDPIEVPLLLQAVKERNRPMDLSDIRIIGEKLENLVSPHEWDFIYNEAGDLPLPFQRIGMQGLRYRKYDGSLCTHCSSINGLLLTFIKNAWKGEPFDNIEFLNGKIMEPSPGMNKTVLLGKCQYEKNKDHPYIKEMIPIKGCPPTMEEVRDAFNQIGIELDPGIVKNIDKGAGILMKKYQGKPEFEDQFFQVK
jgi:uncharacterized protein (DUF362 family)